MEKSSCEYKVNILLALYKPNYKWLGELLESLNNQTYKNIELIAYDDCPQEYTDESIFEKYIVNFPYKIIRGKENKGSNKAFEYLTLVSDGDYLAYCDQDDIWREDKIEEMVAAAVLKNAEMVCCDLAVINEHSVKIHESYKEVSKRHIFKEGNDVYKTLLLRNFVIGCASLFKGETAKKAIPFCKYFFHDHWLSLIASLNGYGAFVDKSLVYYRIHENNQTGVFLGINNKRDYFEKRIEVFYKRNMESYERLSKYEFLKEYLDEVNEWAKARRSYFNRFSFKDLHIVLKYKRFGKSVALFEALMPFMPNFVFGKLLEKIKKGKI